MFRKLIFPNTMLHIEFICQYYKVQTICPFGFMSAFEVKFEFLDMSKFSLTYTSLVILMNIQI